MSEIVYPAHFQDERERSAYRQGFDAGVNAVRINARAGDPEYAELQRWALEQSDRASEALSRAGKAERELAEAREANERLARLGRCIERERDEALTNGHDRIADLHEEADDLRDRLQAAEAAIGRKDEALTRIEAAADLLWRTDKPNHDALTDFGRALVEALEHAGMTEAEGRYAFAPEIADIVPDTAEPVSTGETAWLIEETWSGGVHYIHADFDAEKWRTEADRVRTISRRKQPFITKDPDKAMRFPTKEDAELWLGCQPRWISCGDQYQAREHAWPAVLSQEDGNAV